MSMIINEPEWFILCPSLLTLKLKEHMERTQLPGLCEGASIPEIDPVMQC